MPTRTSRLGLRLAAGLLLTSGMWCASANAGDGFYAAVALERSITGVDYEKSVEFASPFSVMTADDRARDPVDGFNAALGYRWPLSHRLYLAGEVVGAFHVNGKVAGFLGGTGEGGTDVWPGAWSLERGRAATTLRTATSPEPAARTRRRSTRNRAASLLPCHRRHQALRAAWPHVYSAHGGWIQDRRPGPSARAEASGAGEVAPLRAGTGAASSG